MEDLKNELKHFRNKLLSGKTLLGLADMSFFAFEDAEKKIEAFGIHFDKIKAFALISDMVKIKDRSYTKFANILVFDYEVTKDERNAIGRSLCNLLKFRLSGKSLSDATSNLSKNLYVIFAFLQRKNGNANLILDWILENLKSLNFSREINSCVRNSKANINILCNTLLSHLIKNSDKTPLRYPKNEKFYDYVCINLITNPNAKPNIRKNNPQPKDALNSDTASQNLSK